MPLPMLVEAVFKGFDSIPYAYPILKTLPWLAFLSLLKVYFGGARNTSERLMHSKVVMITVDHLRTTVELLLILLREVHLASALL